MSDTEVGTDYKVFDVSGATVENSYALYWTMDVEPVRIEAEHAFVLTIEWPGFRLDIPWPKGLTAAEAIRVWKASR